MRLLKVGRDASCDIVLHSDKVSSLHAEITLLNSGDIMLEDKGSRNGTFVMNRPIQPGKSVSIKRGDMVRFADVELQWSQVPMPEDNSAYKAIFGIGTHFNNDIQVSGSTVSRYHATIKVGKDNKVYIVDHSKNGTTVDGVKIPPHSPYRIKKNSAVVCGGVAVNLSKVSWPSNVGLTILKVVAVVLVLAGLGFGTWTFLGNRTQKFEDGQLYNMYNNSVVMLVGVYHFEVSIGDYDLSSSGLPTKFIAMKDNSGRMSFADVTKASQDVIYQFSSYTATGFFVSADGKIVTNLHVAKPWLFNGVKEKIELRYKEMIGQLNPALVSLVKVEGVLDKMYLIPQGKYFSSENAITCRVLSAGDDVENDIALVQSERSELPHGCRAVNVKDSIDVNEAALTVGKHIYTIGFPFGTGLQDLKSEKGIQVLARGGSITQATTEYSFSFDAASYQGASGSPIFNENGMLVGVLNAGVEVSQGFNYGIKAKFVKEMLDKPFKK